MGNARQQASAWTELDRHYQKLIQAFYNNDKTSEAAFEELYKRCCGRPVLEGQTQGDAPALDPCEPCVGWLINYFQLGVVRRGARSKTPGEVKVYVFPMPQEAPDLAQICMTKIWRSRPPNGRIKQYDERRGTVRVWIRWLAGNVLLDQVRRKLRQPLLISLEAPVSANSEQTLGDLIPADGMTVSPEVKSWCAEISLMFIEFLKDKAVSARWRSAVGWDIVGPGGYRAFAENWNNRGDSAQRISDTKAGQWLHLGTKELQKRLKIRGLVPSGLPLRLLRELVKRALYCDRSQFERAREAFTAVLKQALGEHAAQIVLASGLEPGKELAGSALGGMEER